jgi:hypothetical protein
LMACADAPLIESMIDDNRISSYGVTNKWT